jgi:hypothetical protein
MKLNEWQERLSAYFTDLRSKLDASGNPRPIFAVEHDLNSSEFEALTACLREHTNSSSPAERHYHAWSVYAAEIGYKFKGDEYWQTFAEGLPNWKDDDRDCIKDAFYAFKRDIRGAIPSGSWARHFAIICWPITHAVLAKDLQRHLARILYEVRGEFTPELLNNRTALGKLIAANSEKTSSRFRKFAEEFELVGRISVALLTPESEAAAGLLAPHTLKRITADLQVEKSAHAWLAAARQRASTVKIRGFKTRQRIAGVALPEALDAELEASEGIPQEHLELIIKQTGEGSWSVFGRMPNLAHIESSNAAYQRIFTSQRAYIDNSEKSHFAPRYFAINRQDVLLKNWPTPKRSILRFEPSPPELTEVLNKTCSIPNLSSALFRLRDDGTGIHVMSKVIRPGESYVLVSSEPFPATTYLRESKRVTIACDGMHGIHLDVPGKISELYHESVRSLGLNVSLALQVRPVGSPPKRWDDEGEVEWFESSPKVLAISSTVEVNGLALNLLGNNSDTVIRTLVDGHGPVYVDLENLKVGEYQLQLVAQVGALEEGLVTGGISVSIVPDDDFVLSPEIAQGFTILSSPTLPTFEELWANVVNINIYGPRGAQLKTHLAFFSDPTGNTSPFFTHPLGKMTIPFTESDWSSVFDRAKKDKKVLAAQEDAVSCRLTWRSLELGESTLHCEREFVPFRWSVRTKNNHHKMRLIQNDSTRQLHVAKATFVEPASLTPLELSSRLEFEQADEGGLFVARSETSAASVVLTSPAHSGFGSLRPPVETRIPPARDARSLMTLCEAFALWTGAEFANDPFLRLKRDAAVGMVKTAILESICGGPWASAETGLEKGRLSVPHLCGMIGNAKDYKFQRSLTETIPHAASLTNEELAMVAVDLVQAANLIRVRQAGPISHQELVNTFVDLLERDIAIDQSWKAMSPAVYDLAMDEVDLMRLMRLLMLVRQQTLSDGRRFAAVTA